MNVTAIETRLLKDQRRVFDAATELKAYLNGPGGKSADALSEARWRFASVLLQHLAVMERHVYAKLEQDPRAEVRGFFAKTKLTLVQCFEAYAAHMEDWPTSRAILLWSVYRPKSIAVVDRFLCWLECDEASLFPLVRRAKIDVSRPSAVSSNWVRKAFTIKDSVEKR